MEKMKKINCDGYNVCYYSLDRKNEVILICQDLAYYKNITQEQCMFLVQIIENVDFCHVGKVDIHGKGK